MGVWYATREDLKSALDIKLTARADRHADRALEAASRSVEGLLHRPTIAPTLATRTFDWPNHQYARPWRLWLEADTLVSATTVTSGGVAVPATDYFLRPDTGPPFTHLELDLDSTAAFGAGDTHQRSIAITGLYGYRNDETQVGQLAANLGVSGSAAMDLDPTVGVGTVLRIENERLLVSAKTMVDSGQNLGNTMAASAAADVVQVSNGAVFDTDVILLLDSERMLVVDVAGNNLVVKRGWDGSTLAAHTAGIDVYGLTGYTVERGQLGTTAVAHNSGAAIFRWEPPPLIRSLCLAEAIVTLQQDQAGWARTAGSGDNEREVAGRGVKDLREQAYVTHGRKARSRAV